MFPGFPMPNLFGNWLTRRSNWAWRSI
jgi:hypothetical protein